MTPTSPEEGQKLLDEYKKNKKSQHVAEGDNKDIDASSTMMYATFARLETRIICADGGSDINLMPEELLSSLLARGADIKVHNYNVPRKYDMACKGHKNNRVFIECDKEATMDVELKIRLGKSLLL